MTRPLLFVLLAFACSDSKKQKPSPRPQAPASAPGVTGKTGPIEMMAADGAPFTPLTIAQYPKEITDASRVVVAKTFPKQLSPLAGAGVNLHAGGKNVSWVIDGTPAHGFVFFFDENANGDLGDDPRHDFKRAGDAWELALTTHMPDTFSGAPVPAPVRIRFRNGEFRIQSALVRRGTLPLPNGPMQFALVGDSGQFGLDHHFIAFDLDRDGKLDVDALDNPELFHVFEKGITIDDQSYGFELALDGAQLTLRPLKDSLPPRPPLAVGTPAPEIAVTDLDGKQATLSGLRGKVVLLDFWATSCAPCVAALPRLVELRKRYAERGFEIMSIAMQSDDVREVLANHRTGIQAIDDSVQTAWRVDRYPMYFLVGRDGNILCSRCRLDKLEQMLASGESFK